LQTLAKPGSVCISAATYDQVRKVLPITFRDLGAQQVKNLHEPIRAYELTELKEGAPARIGDVKNWDPSAGERQPLPLPDKPSIAVLPFQNMSGDPEQEYFADGIVEDIITALSRFKSLFVIARNSSFTYKGKAVDIKQVGRELGVRYVLEGSVRKAGGKLRITGQLIEAATGAHLWADRFDGPLDDIFELQDKVTSSVVGAIAPRLDQAEIERSERKPTESLAAVDLYYRALQCFRRLNREGNEEAVLLARRAISLDPKFSSAYGLVVNCYVYRRDGGWITDEEVAEGKQYALRATELGDDAFALAISGHFFANTLRDAETGDVIVDRALAINPNLAAAWVQRGWISFPRPTRTCPRSISVCHAPQSPRRNPQGRGWVGRSQLLSAPLRDCPVMGQQVDYASKGLRHCLAICVGQLRHAGTYCRGSGHAGSFARSWIDAFSNKKVYAVPAARGCRSVF
jgi:adenylate cyclase